MSLTAQTEQLAFNLASAAPPPNVSAEIIDLFEQFTFAVIRSGMPRYSARAVLHRMRWHHHIEKGNRDFKCNNNWTPALARWFMLKYPEHKDFFETPASSRGG